MSTTHTTRVPGPAVAEDAPRRVRHQARDVVVLMGFSLGVSVALAASLLLLAGLGR
ncbi:hypothetical protein [Nocardioides litoris]|uniref:hypothetical protein n=1 Tax=Nocardioides litoris TaxID=1926648 RepID=UPI001476C355|nr:hypothetical protein [Nocardioides litoris]